MALKIFLKKILLIILAIVGYLLFIPLWLVNRKRKLVILRYHSINDYRRHEVNVKVKTFKQQMGFLAKYYKPISLKEAFIYLKNKKDIPKKAVVVTFDDGYEDNYVNAYPMLKQLQIPATIFLIAGYIGTDKILPHDIGDNPLNNRLLSWKEVREMTQDGVEFGSHTLSHMNLTRRDLDINSEILESKRIIEKELDKEVWAISYPYGLLKDFNHEVKQAVRQVGYSCGCSAMNGVNDTQTDIFELRRIGIEASDNMFTFRAKLNGALDLLVIKDKPVFNRLLNIFNKVIGV